MDPSSEVQEIMTDEGPGGDRIFHKRSDDSPSEGKDIINEEGPVNGRTLLGGLVAEVDSSYWGL